MSMNRAFETSMYTAWILQILVINYFDISTVTVLGRTNILMGRFSSRRSCNISSNIQGNSAENYPERLQVINQKVTLNDFPSVRSTRLVEKS